MTAPVDHTLLIRQAVITRLLATSGVTNIIDQRAYGQRVPDNPTWPFVRYGPPNASPFEATKWGGTEADITLHAFAIGTDEGACATLAAAIVAALAGDELPLASGVGLVSLDWIGTQIIPDGEESTGYHAIIRFSVVTTAE